MGCAKAPSAQLDLAAAEAHPPTPGGRGVEPVEHPLCQDEDDAPRANLHAVAASMNERLRQLPVTWVQAKNKTAITR